LAEPRAFLHLASHFSPKRTQEFPCSGIYGSPRLKQMNEGEESIGSLMFGLSIREPGKPAEMAPVRRALVSAKTLGQDTGGPSGSLLKALD